MRRRPDADDRAWIPEDSVDGLRRAWEARRPQLDFTAMGVVTRLGRVRRHVEAELERVFAGHDLEPATFAALVTLERLGDSGPVAPQQLMDELGLPAAAIEARVDELVNKGLAERADAGVTLSAAGRERFDLAVPAHLANQRRLLLALTPEELDQLAALLGKLLSEFEGSRPAADAVLGATVAPAHLAVELREAVGLPPAAGLLVRSVDRDGPAARAGLRTGDVLLRSGRRELRSAAALYAAVAASSGRLRLRVLRGADEELDVTVTLDGAPARAASAGRAAYPEHVV